MSACLESESLSVFVRFRHLFWNKNVILGLMRMMEYHYNELYYGILVLPSSVVLKHAQAVPVYPFCYFQTKVLYMNFE
jgi:hypothetical protein